MEKSFLHRLKQPNWVDYRSWHLGAAKVRDYVRRFRDPLSVKYLYWQLEKALLAGILSRPDTPRQSLLDFACGAGRVLHHLEGRFQRAMGVDLSRSMLSRAVRSGGRSLLVLGDVTRGDFLRSGARYDVITAFRFFLNADPPLRRAVLRWIHRHLHEDGLLICNFHFNPLSAMGLRRRFREVVRRIPPKQMKLASVREACELLSRSGFAVISLHGYGHLLYRKDRYPCWTRLCLPVEKVLMKLPFLSPFARNFLIVARKKEGSPAAGR